MINSLSKDTISFLKRWPLFIAFEGIDGSGKTTISNKLLDLLKWNQIPCVCAYEPTTKPTGILYRDLLKCGEYDPKSLALLLFADRYHHESKYIIPALVVPQKHTVVLDRDVISTCAYLIALLPEEDVSARKDLQNLITHLSQFIVRPNITFYMTTNIDLFKNYTELLNSSGTHTVCCIDSNQSEREVFSKVLVYLEKYVMNYLHR